MRELTEKEIDQVDVGPNKGSYVPSLGNKK